MTAPGLGEVAPEERPPAALPPLVRLFPIVGAILALLTGGGLLWVYLERRAQFLPTFGSVGALFVAGKEGGIPLGLAAGGDPTLVAMAILGTDLAMTFLLYPLVHAAFDGVQRTRGLLGGMLRTAQKNARRHRKVVDRYGAAGLYLYMLVPFAFNSPLVGIALGRIAQLSPLLTMAVVSGAIATTTVLWTVLVAYGLGRLLHVGPWVPVAVSLGVTAGVLGWGYVETRRQRHAEAQEMILPSGERDSPDLAEGRPPAGP
ncbi:MAG TPA: small multi-drug export protein [Candidatus Thermoplasmatota archaeon]|nr:small multi-drug export protein [Candidatus Thermoplasmatota archaeon]